MVTGHGTRPVADGKAVRGPQTVPEDGFVQRDTERYGWFGWCGFIVDRGRASPLR
jgi:hypothetical protein